MLTGVIVAVDNKVNPPVSGTIKMDETGEVIPFNDPNFGQLGLVVGDPVQFELDPNSREPIAINLSAVAPPPVEKTITGPSGGFTINANETYIVKGAAAIVTGDIIVNSGKLVIAQDAKANGNISGTDATIVARNKGSVTGDINLNSGNLKVIGGGSITGNIIIKDRARVVVGNADGPGKITGTIEVRHARLFSVTKDSKIN